MRPIRIRIHRIPDSTSNRIWAYLGDGGGRHGVVGVLGLLVVSKLRLLEKMILGIRYENGRNLYREMLVSGNEEAMAKESFPEFVHECALWI